MKKIVYAIWGIILLFLINVWLSFSSENYNFFLKKIKYWDVFLEKEAIKVSDEYSYKNNSKTCNCETVQAVYCQNFTGTIAWVQTPNPNVTKDTLNLTGQLNILFQSFDENVLLKKPYDEYYKIFDITDEYPTEYITYSNINYELYLFPTWDIDNIYNIFELLSLDKNTLKKFTLNKVNNFGVKSFFLNLAKDDGKVRLVIYNWKILFWLNIKKSYYSNIKSILEKF